MTNLLSRTKKENQQKADPSSITPDVFHAQPFRENLQEDWTHSYGFPQVDIWENQQVYCLEAELPGFSKDSISAEYENGYITIRGEKQSQRTLKEENRTYLRSERSFNIFLRSFYIGDVEEEKIKVLFQKEILSIRIPKLNNRKQFTFKQLEIE
ncbi:Hsp20 family protein [Sinobaca sp. H24]|uniref:Hsp20 family protein n=1 Tax=Sinobaca sp. H24 TaxID=2923376 RepID=UPI00207AFCCB|nr:Hsp20 family protein [Sinobaca sp. H24]